MHHSAVGQEEGFPVCWPVQPSCRSALNVASVLHKCDRVAGIVSERPMCCTMLQKRENGLGGNHKVLEAGPIGTHSSPFSLGYRVNLTRLKGQVWTSSIHGVIGWNVFAQDMCLGCNVARTCRTCLKLLAVGRTRVVYMNELENPSLPGFLYGQFNRNWFLPVISQSRFCKS